MLILTHNVLWSLDKPSNVFCQMENRDALINFCFSGKMKREMKPTCRGKTYNLGLMKELGIKVKGLG